MIVVIVGEDGVLDIPGVKAQPINGINDHVEGVDVTAVNEHQTVTGIDQMAALLECAHIVKIVGNLEGVHSAQPRLCCGN